ncbi:MAG: hypothetical protein JXR36_02885, partial [Bacteroidales bacterium]|nr:hypothetical protein [Bacteroidales bacterium]
MLKCSKSACLMSIKKNIKKKVKKVLVEIKMYLFLQSQNKGISGQRFGYGKKKFFDLLASSKRRQVKNKKFNAQSDRVKR